MKNQKGFTRVEIVIVIVLLLILGAIIWVAVDPATRFATERDNQRRSHVVSILNAVLKYQTMNDGQLPAGIDINAATAQVLGVGTNACDLSCGAAVTAMTCADLSPSLIGQYLEDIPVDPLSGSAINSDYFINVTATGRILVGSCDPEVSRSISVTR